MTDHCNEFKTVAVGDGPASSAPATASVTPAVTGATTPPPEKKTETATTVPAISAQETVIVVPAGNTTGERILIEMKDNGFAISTQPATNAPSSETTQGGGGGGLRIKRQLVTPTAKAVVPPGAS